jgi:hypothetical protein
MNSKPSESQKQKKPYRKPECIQVALRPEEAVLGSCKGSGSGPAGGCTGGSNTPACRGHGS